MSEVDDLILRLACLSAWGTLWVEWKDIHDVCKRLDVKLSKKELKRASRILRAVQCEEDRKGTEEANLFVYDVLNGLKEV